MFKSLSKLMFFALFLSACNNGADFSGDQTKPVEKPSPIATPIGYDPGVGTPGGGPGGDEGPLRTCVDRPDDEDCRDRYFPDTDSFGAVAYEDRIGGDRDYEDFISLLKVRERFIKGSLKQIKILAYPRARGAGDPARFILSLDGQIHSTEGSLEELKNTSVTPELFKGDGHFSVKVRDLAGNLLEERTGLKNQEVLIFNRTKDAQPDTNSDGNCHEASQFAEILIDIDNDSNTAAERPKIDLSKYRFVLDNLQTIDDLKYRTQIDVAEVALTQGFQIASENITGFFIPVEWRWPLDTHPVISVYSQSAIQEYLTWLGNGKVGSISDFAAYWFNQMESSQTQYLSNCPLNPSVRTLLNSFM